jgi:hypothetical protein
MVLGMAVGTIVGFLAVTRWLERAPPPLETANVRVVFAAGNQGIRLLGKGWASPESWGIWSIGPTAELAIQLEHMPADNVDLRLEARAFPHLPNNMQRVNVVVNGSRLSTLEANTEGILRGPPISIPAKVAAASRPMRIVFEITRPSSPKDLNLGQDTRQLGIGLMGISLEYRFKLEKRT